MKNKNKVLYLREYELIKLFGKKKNNSKVWATNFLINCYNSILYLIHYFKGVKLHKN